MIKSLLILTFLSIAASMRSQSCFSHIRQKEILQAQPELIKNQKQIEAYTKKWVQNYAQRPKSSRVYTIPVVVHVVWRELEENISSEQIQSQIDVLNRDFNALNIEVDQIPEVFRNLVANTEIRFCLADKTPSGEASAGFTRTQTNYPDVGTAQDEFGRFRIFYSDAGGQDAWDTQRYLNIWVAKRGYGSGLAAFPGIGPAEEDGLVVDYRFFGDEGSAADNRPYHLGRTTTHEVGHYLNLLHPWGSAAIPNCETDDEVEDTPLQSKTYLGECPSSLSESCGSHDFFFNFMNFTDDSCMAMFTPGQKARMLAALEGSRSGLIENQLCMGPNTDRRAIFSKKLKIRTDLQNKNIWIELYDLPRGELQIFLYNSLGQLCLQDKRPTNSNQAISLSNLSSGIYILQLKYKELFYAHKIFIR